MAQTLKKLLNDINACSDAIEWAADKTIKEVVDQCHRGDWLLWLAKKVDIGLQPLTLAKGYCANTVRHLMKDERSIKAIDTAIAYGEGYTTIEELKAYAAAAYAATYPADAYADAYAAAAAYAATYPADAYAATYPADAYTDAAAYTAAAAYAATYPADAYVAAAAKKENQMQTADICRKYIGQIVIDKVNELLNK